MVEAVHIFGKEVEELLQANQDKLGPAGIGALLDKAEQAKQSADEGLGDDLARALESLKSFHDALGRPSGLAPPDLILSDLAASARALSAEGCAVGLEGSAAEGVARALRDQPRAALERLEETLAEVQRLLSEAIGDSGRLAPASGCLAGAARAAGACAARRAAGRLREAAGHAGALAGPLAGVGGEFRAAFTTVSAASDDVARSVEKLKGIPTGIAERKFSCFEDLSEIDTAALEESTDSTVKDIICSVNLIKTALQGLVEKVTRFAKRVSECASQVQGAVTSAFDAPKVLGCCLPGPNLAGSPVAKRLLEKLHAFDLSPVVSTLKESSEHMDRTVLMPVTEYAELVSAKIKELGGTVAFAREASAVAAEVHGNLEAMRDELLEHLNGVEELGGDVEAALVEASQSVGGAVPAVRAAVKGLTDLPPQVENIINSVHTIDDALNVDVAPLERSLDVSSLDMLVGRVDESKQRIDSTASRVQECAGRLAQYASGAGDRVRDAFAPALRMRPPDAGPSDPASLAPLLHAAELLGGVDLGPLDAGLSELSRCLHDADTGRIREDVCECASQASSALRRLGEALAVARAAKAASEVAAAPAALAAARTALGGVVSRGKEARGASSGDSYRFGDVTRGLAAAALGAVGRATPRG